MALQIIEWGQLWIYILIKGSILKPMYIYIEDNYYGKISAQKNCVTGFEVPDFAKKIRLSFSTVFDPTEELESFEMDEETKDFL